MKKFIFSFEFNEKIVNQNPICVKVHVISRDRQHAEELAGDEVLSKPGLVITEDTTFDISKGVVYRTSTREPIII